MAETVVRQCEQQELAAGVGMVGRLVGEEAWACHAVAHASTVRTLVHQGCDTDGHPSERDSKAHMDEHVVVAVAAAYTQPQVDAEEQASRLHLDELDASSSGGELVMASN
jgi:hypothetical protein